MRGFESRTYLSANKPLGLLTEGLSFGDRLTVMGYSYAPVKDGGILMRKPIIIYSVVVLVVAALAYWMWPNSDANSIPVRQSTAKQNTLVESVSAPEIGRAHV